MIAAIRTGRRRVEVRHLPPLEPAADEVMVRVSLAGICGTDVRHYLDPAAPAKTRASGHELVGVVTARGAEGAGVQPGHLVTASAYAHCGRCPACRAGRPNICADRRWVAADGHGGFAEYATLKACAVHVLDPGTAHDRAVLAEPCAVACRAVRKARRYGSPIAVVGCGTIGQLCLRVAAALGVHVLAVARHPVQRALAARAGADVLDGAPGTGPDGRAGAVIVAAEGASAMACALRLVAPGGTVVLIGEDAEAITVDTRTIVVKEVALLGSNTYATDLDEGESDMRMAIRMLNDPDFDIDGVITHTFPLSHAAAAFAAAADKDSGSVKVVLDARRSEGMN